MSSSSLRLAPGFMHPFIPPRTHTLIQPPSPAAQLPAPWPHSLPSSCPPSYPTTRPCVCPAILALCWHPSFRTCFSSFQLARVHTSPSTHPRICSWLYPSIHRSTHHVIHPLVHPHVHPFFLAPVFTLCANIYPLFPYLFHLVNLKRGRSLSCSSGRHSECGKPPLHITSHLPPAYCEVIFGNQSSVYGHCGY